MFVLSNFKTLSYVWLMKPPKKECMNYKRLQEKIQREKEEQKAKREWVCTQFTGCTILLFSLNLNTCTSKIAAPRVTAYRELQLSYCSGLTTRRIPEVPGKFSYVSCFRIAPWVSKSAAQPNATQPTGNSNTGNKICM